MEDTTAYASSRFLPIAKVPCPLTITPLWFLSALAAFSASLSEPGSPVIIGISPRKYLLSQSSGISKLPLLSID